jgi:hypothetical protein
MILFLLKLLKKKKKAKKTKNKYFNEMRKVKRVKISAYKRKANKVKEHFRRLDEFHQLNDGGQGVIDVINAIGSAKPEVKTTLAIDEQTGTILKNIGYTLAGAIVLGAVIRLKAK